MKSSRKTLLSNLLLCVMLFCITASLACSAAALDADCTYCKNSQGQTFSLNEQYVLSKKLGVLPATFEAEFKINKDELTRKVTLLGNDGSFYPAIVYEVAESGCPAVTLRSVSGRTSEKTYTFNEVNVATGEKVHLAIVSDYASKQLHCYVDGQLRQTLSGIMEVSAPLEKYNFVIGGDHLNGNTSYFRGVMYSVSVWSDMRTKAEILKDYETEADTTDRSLIACYDLTLCESCMTDDLSSKNNDLDRIDLWLDKSEVDIPENYDYSFAVVGDTQTMNYHNSAAMGKLYNWIIDNKDEQKIEYVIGLGDITDKSSDGEWAFANETISKLNGKVPYILTRGNHDDWDDFNRTFHNGYYENTLDGMMVSGSVSLTDINQPGVRKKTAGNGTVTYVTASGDTPEGGNVTGDITNAYQYLTVGETDYIIINLDFCMNSKALKWANEVIEAHPDRKAIVITHAYMNCDGTSIDVGDCDPMTAFKGYTDAQNGEAMWEKCFAKHENLILVLSGHKPWQHILYRQDTGNKGNTVTQMLIDPQTVDANIGATAMVALFYFSDKGEALTVRYYSVMKDCYGSELSQFTVHLNHKYENAVTKATTAADGKIASLCKCGDVKSEAVVYSPKTFTLSKTSYTYNGKEQKPSVTVKDRLGNPLKESTDYSVSYPKSSTNPGKYTVKITLKGNYSGEKTLYYTISPSATGKLSANQTTSSVTLTWPSVKGVDGYKVYTYNSYTKKLTEVADVSSATCTVEKLSAGTTYSFRVRAYKNSDKALYGEYSPILTTATKPAVPQSFTSSSQTATAVTLKWNKVKGADGYRIYQYNSKAKKWKQIKDVASGSTVNYTVTDLTSGTKYKFRLTAYIKEDATICSDATATLTTATSPAAPKKFTSSSPTATSVTLKWNKVAGADGYRIYQYNPETKKWEKIKTVTSGSTVSYEVKKLVSGTKYKFRIKAYIKAGGTVWSESAATITAATKLSAPRNFASSSTTLTSVTLKWNKVEGADGYRIYRYDSETKKWKKLKTVTSGSTVSYEVKKLTPGIKHKFRIKAYIKAGGTIWSDSAKTLSIVTRPSAPSLNVSSTGKGRVTFAFSGTTDKGGYQLYISEKRNDGYKKVASYKPNTLKASKSDLESGKIYYFKVRAFEKVNGKVIYSSWSEVRSVKIK